MKKNMGKADKIIRLVVGIVIITVGIMYQQWWGIIGLVPVATSFLNFCPLYAIFGIKTCSSC